MTVTASAPPSALGVTGAVRDLATMTRRSLLRMRRNPSMTVTLVGMPVVLLLMFVFVFGGAFGAGVAAGAAPGGAGRAAYLDYITPAILVMTAGSIAQNTAIAVAMDMTGGMVTRLRTMPVSSVAALGGHVLGALVQTLLAAAAVLVVTLLLGLRPGAGPADWLGLCAFFALFAATLTSLAAAMGATARSVESASNTPMILMLLPFFGSGFVPVDTMPGPIRFFAEHQPFTPVIETVRDLLTGGDIVWSTVWTAVVWCLALAVVGWLWARAGYRRPRS